MMWLFDLVCSQGRIPARWMALESLEERTHTSKSDVYVSTVISNYLLM